MKNYRPCQANDASFDLREKWRTRLEQARARHLEASAEFRDVVWKVNSGSTPVADGSHSVLVARMRENAAQNEFMRVLRIFTDLVTEGKLPEGE
jgi:hypothetical protein